MIQDISNGIIIGCLNTSKVWTKGSNLDYEGLWIRLQYNNIFFWRSRENILAKKSLEFLLYKKAQFR